MMDFLFSLCCIFVLQYNSLKIPIIKHQEKQFIMIRKLSQFFIFKLGMNDTSLYTPYKSFSSTQLTKVTYTKCIEFNSSRDIDNTNQIKQVFNFLNVKVIADEKNDILNGAEIIIVNSCDSTIGVANQDKKIDTELLFNIFKDQKYESTNVLWHHCYDKAKKLDQPTKLYINSARIMEIPFTNLFPFNTNSRVYSSSMEDFLNSENWDDNRIICCPYVRMFLESLYSVSIKNNCDKHSTKGIFLCFSSFTDQLNHLTEFNLSSFEEREGYSNSWIKKLKEYVGSVQNDENFAENPLTLTLKLTSNICPGKFDILSYRSLLSKIKRRKDLKGLYGDLYALVLWSSPKKFTLSLHKKDLAAIYRIISIFFNGNLILFAFFLLFFICTLLRNGELYFIVGRSARKKFVSHKKEKSVEKKEQLEEENNSGSFESLGEKNGSKNHADSVRFEPPSMDYTKSLSGE